MKTNPLIKTATSLAIALAFGGLLTGPSLSHAASTNIYIFTSQPALEAGTNGLAGFLRGLGYAVTVEQDPGVDPYEFLDVIGTTNATLQAQYIAQLTTNNLIIVQREYGSGTLASSETERALWNNMNVPILCCNAPMLPVSKWGWIGDQGQVADVLPANLGLYNVNSSQSIMQGMNTDLFQTNGAYYGGYYNPGASPNLVNVASADISPYFPMCLGVWDENGSTQTLSTTNGVPYQTYLRRRVFFNLPDWRVVTPPNLNNFSYDGKMILARVVEYAITGTNPCTVVTGNFNPADGSQFNTTATSFSFNATCTCQPIPTSGIQVIVNGQDVSGSLQFAGTTTSRQVTYPGLVSNQVYNITITVSNATGVYPASLQFDTFDYSSVQSLYPDFDNIFTSPLPSNAYRIFVQLQSATAQVISLAQSNASELPPAARLKGVFYVPGSMTAPQLLPLTDALGNQMIVRTPNDTVSFIPGTSSGVTFSTLYLVPVVNPPSTLLPALGQASPHPGQANVSATANLDLDLINGDNPVVPSSAQFYVDGANVSAAAQTTITGTASGAHVHYAPPNFLAPSQAHSVLVVYSDNAAHTVTNQYSFSVVQMPILPPSLAVPVSAGISPGFNLLLSMAPSNTDNIWVNTSARAEAQLAGTLVGPSGPVTNQISGTTSPSPYTETNVINYSFDGNPPVPSGSGLYPTLPGCVLFPFGGAVLAENMALSATTWLELPAGVVTFGVASASGFKLTGGYDTNLLLGTYEGSRGAQVPSEFPVLVYQPGLYPVRLLHYAAGDAAVEFYTANNTNAGSTSGRVLVNGADDSATAVPVPAYSIVRPNLSVARNGGQIVVSWYGSGNFQLKQKNQLGPGSWSLVGQTPVVQGLLHTVSLALPASGNMFYRLELQP